MMDPHHRRRQAIARAFSEASASYSAAATLQERIASWFAQELLAYLDRAPLPAPARVLEIGCGCGRMVQLLAAQLPQCSWLLSDVAEGMVRTCRTQFPQHQYLVMDGEAPALRGGFHLLLSNLALQWFGQPAASLSHLQSLLAPDGVLACTTFGKESFREWRNACAQAEVPCGIGNYPDLAELCAMLPAAPIEVRELTVRWRHERPLAFLQSFRAIGSQVPRDGYRPLSPAQLRRALAQLPTPTVMTQHLLLFFTRTL